MPLEERLRVGLPEHEARDPRVGPGVRLQLGDEERVREEAHVEHEVRVGGEPEAEAERDDGDAEPRALRRRRSARVTSRFSSWTLSVVVSTTSSAIAFSSRERAPLRGDAVRHGAVSPASGWRRRVSE